MEVVSLVVQSCIGLIFAIYGVCLLLSNRKKEKRMKSKFVLSFVCILVGICLVGYVICQFGTNKN